MIPQIIVHRHIKKNEVKKYIFGIDADKADIPLIIFQDDTILKTLTKIAIGIHEYDKQNPVNLKTIPYAWHKNKILRFERLSGGADAAIPINPWDGISLRKDRKEIINYTDNAFLNINEIHIVFASDLPAINEVYFPNSSVEWKINATYDSLKKESDFLYDIYNNNTDSIDYSNFIYTRVKYTGNITKWRESKKLDCSQLFDKMHSTSDVPFIQFVQDSSKIVYKVYKKHEINSLNFAEWTSYERIPKVTIITIYFTISVRKNIYGRMTIDDTGNIYIEYKLDSREKLDWSVIHESTLKITKWIEKYVAKIKINLESLSLKSVFTNGERRKIKELTDLLSKLHLLFHYHKLQNNFLEVSFKRSANFKYNLDVADVIISEIRRGVPVYDIINNLVELGMSDKDALEWVQQYSETSEDTDNKIPKKKLSLKQTGCILIFSEATTGFNVQIENIASLEEIKSIAKWIQGTLNIKKKTKQIIPEKSKTEPESSSSSQSSASSIISSSSTSESSSSASASASKSEKKKKSSNDDIFEEDVGELELGGALGKKNRGYFIKLLQQSDPAIFRDHKPYPRECLGNNFRQPIALTNSEKDKIDASEYKNAYDNSVKYGSDDKHINNYICPRIWCPVSKIPITSAQLAKNNGKCPAPHNEEPLLLYQSEYWDNNPDLKHNVGFLSEGKKKTDKGFCLPCCMKKETKKEAINECRIDGEKTGGPRGSHQIVSDEPLSKKQKEVNYYIKSTGAPLPPDRFGIIPKDMFFYLFPNESYLNCTTTIKANECLLRKGIHHSNNSFMSAVSYILGFNNIKEFVKDIQKKLDIITFISAENSLLLKSFIDESPIIPTHEIRLHKEWNEFHAAAQAAPSINSKYKSFIDYSSDYKLSRELAIYRAYVNFINYLKSSSSVAKNPIHLINVLVKTHNIQIVIFKKNGADSAIVQCPMYSNLSELLYMTTAKKLKLGLIIEDNDYYEPLELKKSGKDSSSIATFDIDTFEPMKELINKCPVKDPIITYIEIIRNLITWIDYDKELGTLNSPSSFKIETIIIRPDMRIYGFITKSNIVITLPSNGYPITILPILFDILSIKHLIYLEDIYGKKYTIDKVFKTDLQAFLSKIKEIGLGVILGIETDKSKTGGNLFTSTLVIPQRNPHIIPAIYLTSASNNKIVDAHDVLEGHSSRWYQIQKHIGHDILIHYESLVIPLLTKTKKERIGILKNTYKSIPQKHIVQKTLEEMPLGDGKDAILQWMNLINIEKKVSIYTSYDVKDSGNGKEWVFSQLAIDNGINPVVLNYENEYTVKDRMNLKGNVENIDAIEERKIVFPDMLKKDLVVLEKLPNKWNKFKNFDFNSYNIYNAKKYIIEYVPELMKYIAKKLYVPFNYNEIIELRFKLISGLLDDRVKLSKIFDDPGMLRVWNRELRKKYKTFDDLWKSELIDNDKKDRLLKWENVNKKQTLWTTDIDFYIFAKLMNINILVIKRLEYGEGKDVGKRNEINDLHISSYYYHGDSKMIKSRPIILLYRQKVKTQKYIEYSAIVNPTKGFIVNEIPKDIETIIDYHLQKI